MARTATVRGEETLVELNQNNKQKSKGFSAVDHLRHKSFSFVLGVILQGFIINKGFSLTVFSFDQQQGLLALVILSLQVRDTSLPPF